MKILKRLFWFTTISILFLAGDLFESSHNGFNIIQSAEARVGRPLTPVSVAGVRRRTRRRTAVVTAAVVRPRPAVAPVAVPVAPRYY